VALLVFSVTSGVVPAADEDGRTLCFMYIGSDKGPDGIL
jgi:hypothetical protein